MLPGYGQVAHTSGIPCGMHTALPADASSSENRSTTPYGDVAKIPPPAPAAVLPSSWLSNSTKVELTWLAAPAATSAASLMCLLLRMFGTIALAGSMEELYSLLPCIAIFLVLFFFTVEQPNH